MEKEITEVPEITTISIRKVHNGYLVASSDRNVYSLDAEEDVFTSKEDVVKFVVNTLA